MRLVVEVVVRQCGEPGGWCGQLLAGRERLNTCQKDWSFWGNMALHCLCSVQYVAVFEINEVSIQ